MEGNQNTNQGGDQGSYFTGSPESAMEPNNPNNSSMDGISNGQEDKGFHLGPNEISPNLAKEGTYFDESASTNLEQPTSAIPEMQVPIEEKEPGIPVRTIAIIGVIIFLLLGSIGGIVYFLKTRNNTVEEVIPTENTESDTSQATENNQATKTEEPKTDATSSTPTPNDQTSSSSQSSSGTTTGSAPAEVTTPEIETPKIETTQPETPKADDAGSVAGSG